MPMARSIPTLVACVSLMTAAAIAEEPTFKTHTINGKSGFESAGVFDVDGDGQLDIVSGDTWYQAPSWTPSKVRDVARQGTYYNEFATLPLDVNGDKKIDFVSCAYFSKNVGWVENPGAKGKEWTYHEIDLPGTSEAAVLVDLNGDGKPDVLPNVTTRVVWYELEQAAAKPVWKKHDFGTEAAGHGVGSGDVNGDGRVDLLTPKGWFEGPADPKAETWVWHPEWNLGATGIQIFARDVDGDGLSDLVYGVGHDYGLYWMKQGKGANGERTWEKHEIDRSIASVHTLLWADLNGDGREELITGKRVYAHEIEPGATDGSVVASYDFDPKKKAWVKHILFQGEAAKNAPEGPKRDALKDFPAGTIGTGLQMTAIDIDHDGDIDLICPGKSGLYLLENLGSSKSSARGETKGFLSR
ncbi:FG-GAP repeat domain-containing protein [Singulisphaera acidiphila]|uniref:FG-GAP repeat protein n=1 Tax=Singulisphaera acidiphila (strain ATCC BAA-1392 / DSM 18658 / VKM B-2454 / MOB10) TaxID=886293 RepID=L0DLS8_SINAD|nr:VCBS repeat-containing protein [Singulisphaera acidiphila]AGA29798.1 FG-GAP repeat protein [Singulisphaera acidiphila DSM 18658]